MKRVKRNWFKALEEGIDDKLINFLVKLKVIKSNVWREYQQNSHNELIKFREEQWRKQARASAHDVKQTYGRAPMSIKPTKARNFR